jgi:hypothetical protein
MTLKNMFAFNAVLATIFGAAFVLAPAQIMALYGAPLPAHGLAVAQLLGAALVGVGVLTWRARLLAQADARRAIVPGLLVANGISAAVLLLVQLQGPGNAFGWLTLALYLLLAAAYGYFQLKAPGSR